MRYTVSAEIIVAASPDRAYAIASDPKMVVQYERGVAAIDVIEEISATERLVRSHLDLFGIRTPFIYRYRYAVGHHYSGVQETGLLRGFFSFSFNAVENGTRIIHREGVFSRIPLVATAVGWFYFRVVGRNGIESELQQLKKLIEQSVTPASLPA